MSLIPYTRSNIPPIFHNDIAGGIDENIPPPAPPPPPDPATPKAPPIRPKDKKPKRLGQLLQAGLLPAVFVGYLTHNLVTLLPHIKRREEEAWKSVPQERARLLALLRTLPGLFGALICVETHGSSKPKAPVKPNAPPKKKPRVGEEVETEQTPEQEAITNALAGKPHYHILLYYPRMHHPQLDMSFFKRRLMEEMPESDVNEKILPEGTKNPSPHFVRAFQYCLKAVRCPVTLAYWKKYNISQDLPPMPEFLPGPLFTYDVDSQEVLSEEGKRFTKLFEECKKWMVTSIPYSAGHAPSTFGRPLHRSVAERSMMIFSEILQEAGIVIGGKQFNKFYQLDAPPTFCYKPVRTFVESFQSLNDLFRHLSYNLFARSIIIQFRDKIPQWFPFAVFQHLPEHEYEWVELVDAFYHIRSGEFWWKNDPRPFNDICFRSYNYAAAELINSIEPENKYYPIDWIDLLTFVCTAQIRQTLVVTDPDGSRRDMHMYGSKINMDLLKTDLARLLRKREPKQPVPFLYGESNSGKTTLISYVRQLYPTTAIGFLNNSVCGLSGINETIPILYCDEFKTAIISREELLLLFDGSQPLPIRRMHQDARQIDNPLMPIIMASNFKPKYDKDDSKALENRVTMYMLENVLIPDRAVAIRIEKSHLFVVHHLNNYLKEKNIN